MLTYKPIVLYPHDAMNGIDIIAAHFNNRLRIRADRKIRATQRNLCVFVADTGEHLQDPPFAARISRHPGLYCF